MPAIVAFRRKWNISSDDFVFPGVTMLFIRTAWFVTIGIVYISHFDQLASCKDAKVLEVFFIGMLCLLFLKILINILLIYHSSRGSIKECGARRAVPKVLYFKLTLFLLEIVWLVVGSFWSTAEYKHCNLVVVEAIRALVALSWIGAVIFILMVVFLFSPLGNDSTAVAASTIWKRRCQLICCTCRSEDATTSDAFSETASLVSTFFQDVDLVPSDIAAGLVLVSREQAMASSNDSTPRQTFGDRHAAIDITDSMLPSESVPEWMTVYKAARIARYALAVYGWPFYSFSHMPCGCCQLCCTFPRKRLSSSESEGSDTCSCNLVSIEKHMDDHHLNAEIYYASFTNELFVNPFVIFLDHEHRSVVLAIRGTLSLKDALVDVTAFSEEIHESFPKSYKAHKGMIKAARNLAQRLKDNDLLLNAFTGQGAGYDFIICGHSLGAGVAAILSMLLKEEFSNLRCISYSPPGGLLSKEAYKASKEYTMSVVLGDDLVPRLSIQTMQDLKVNVMTALQNCSYPKYQIFGSLPLRAANCQCCVLDEEAESLNRPLVTSEQNQHNLYTAEASHYLQNDFREAIESRDLLRIQPPFYAPGCIMYLIPASNSSERNCCFNDTEYTWRWADQTEFLTLKVTPKMGADHMPNKVLEVLDILAPDFPQDIIIEGRSNHLSSVDS
ncbi:diacylglycerol lipase-beta-like [Watersipora subatra]|uniref:diacylglycerol lipase-beta-like n=1 Tax=Watersipora subatra TaxID=2589382 RepID=UPI00355B9AC5